MCGNNIDSEHSEPDIEPESKQPEIPADLVREANRSIEEFRRNSGLLYQRIEAALSRPYLIEEISQLARALSRNLETYIDPIWEQIQSMSVHGQLPELVNSFGLVGASINQQLEALMGRIGSSSSIGDAASATQGELERTLGIPLHRVLPEIARLNIIAGYSLPRIDLDNIASMFKLDVPGLNALTASHSDFVSAYERFIQSSVPQAHEWSASALLFAELSAESHYLHTDVLSQLSAEAEDAAIVQAKDDVRSVIVGTRSGRVVFLLSDLDPQLTALLEGARERLGLNAPDTARHVSSSLRELLTQVLHGLAPDEDVLNWVSDPALLHHDRPTRKARLLYILRNCEEAVPEELLDSDAKAALALFDVLQRGQHAVESGLTGRKLETVIARAEALLVQLLEAGEYSDD